MYCIRWDTIPVFYEIKKVLIFLEIKFKSNPILILTWIERPLTWWCKGFLLLILKFCFRPCCISYIYMKQRIPCVIYCVTYELEMCCKIFTLSRRLLPDPFWNITPYRHSVYNQILDWHVCKKHLSYVIIWALVFFWHGV